MSKQIETQQSKLLPAGGAYDGEWQIPVAMARLQGDAFKALMRCQIEALSFL